MTPSPEDREQARELLGDPRCWDEQGYDEIVDRIASALTKARANSAAMKWIPCSERMPEPSRDVLFVYAFRRSPGRAIAKGAHNDEIWIDDEGVDHILEEVTHWMPLPELPEGAGP